MASTCTDALCSCQLSCHGCSYCGNIWPLQISHSQVGEEGGKRGTTQPRMEVRQREMSFQLISANHVTDHSILTYCHFAWLLVHDLPIWKLDSKEWKGRVFQFF